jgi:hypothetical protein
MRTFIWTIAALTVLSMLGRLAWLAKGQFPPRSRGMEAANVAVDLGLVVWAAVLLANAA